MFETTLPLKSVQAFPQHLKIKMDTKKYGVSLSALKSLQDFQQSIMSKRRKRKVIAMPFTVECRITFNDGKPCRCTIVADSGLISCEMFGVLYLKNVVGSSTETDTTVLFSGKDPLKVFNKLFIEFDKKDDKDTFITSIENVLRSDSDDHSSSSGDSMIQ
ncbi:uncharacterized protein LOC135124644 isoform X2 [Zophobas morio]|uniref:uncharacterized protein LOC135124644 isoform X2 n=1 Tax=Zophobas morio TaxID=2755281 RepID=UPI0030835349